MLKALKALRAKQTETSEEGFTLIELMIVVVIIGILAAIAIPVFANQQKAAIAATVKSDVKNTATEISAALVKNPTSEEVSELPYETISTDGDTHVDVWGYGKTGKSKE